MVEDPESQSSDEQARRYWRHLWLSAIRTFGDVETQRTRWLDPAETNPYFSFVECMCCYFDDAYLGEEDAYRKAVDRGRISAAEARAVAAFHSAAAAYSSPGGDDWNAAVILEDPAWQEVVRLAQEAQRQLLALIDDPAEIAMLTGALEWEEDGQTYFCARLGASYVVPTGRD